MNRLRIIPIILTCVLILLFIVPFNYADLSSSKYNKIEKYLKSELRDSLLPGIAVGIVKYNETVYTNGFGRANSKGSEMNAETPLYVGSVTKGFTALAIMQLNESGEIDVDDKVTEYLPDFKMADKDESDKIESDKIKIRHLLSHMSGISTETGRKRLYGAKETPEEYVEKLKDEVLHNTPGLRFEYSNANYVILGLIIEEVTGSTYDKYAQKHIIEKLNMDKTYFSHEEASENGLATGHRLCYGFQIPNYELINPAYVAGGGLITTAKDMTRYMIAQLNGGKYRNSSVLSPENFIKLHSLPDVFEGETNYAMGWVNTTLDEEPILTHGGALIDYHARIILAPESGWGVIIMSNVNNAYGSAFSYSEIAYNVMRILLDEKIEPGVNLLMLYIIMDIIAALLMAIVLRNTINLAKQALTRREEIKERSKEKRIEKRIRKKRLGKKKWVLVIIDVIIGIFLLVIFPMVIGVLTAGYMYTILFILWGLPDTGIFLLMIGLGSILAGIFRYKSNAY